MFEQSLQSGVFWGYLCTALNVFLVVSIVWEKLWPSDKE